MNSPIPLVSYRILQTHPEIYAFSTTRQGGCSVGPYASMNCTPYTGDDADAVCRNQERLLRTLPGSPLQLVIPWQTHGTQALCIDGTWLSATPEKRRETLQGVDALLTRLSGLCLCISTADCIPLLVYDIRHRAVAAIHAGWRGTVNRIVLRTLEKMQACYGTKGEDVLACIGPGISLQAFEVGEEVYEAFRDANFPIGQISCRNGETHKHHIDLPAANRLQLMDFGVPARQIEVSGLCTYTQYEKFFSARRMGIRSGRMLTGIGIL